MLLPVPTRLCLVHLPLILETGFEVSGGGGSGFAVCDRLKPRQR